MKQLIKFAPILFLSLILISCGNNSTTAPRKSSGKTAEIIVVTNYDTKWEGKVGEAIRNFFNQDYEVLPQSEPLFEIAHAPMENFNHTKMFQSHHNILIVDIDKNSNEPSIEARKDVWSSPQRVINITAPTDEAFVSFFEENKQTIWKILMDSEYERLIKTYRAFRDWDIMNSLRESFHFTMEVPSGFYIAKESAGFAWIRKETQHNSQGIMIYTYDFIDTIAFDRSRIISFRNAMTEEYIPGPSEGSYMVVADDYAPVISEEIEFNGMYAIKTSSLWKLVGDFMGGPFVSYTFIDEKRNKVITIDGYAYAPNKPKRDLLIQTEAIIQSLKFVD